MRKSIFVAAALVVLVGLVGFGLAWHPAIATVNPPQRSSFRPELVARGEQLASLGFCQSCHTASGRLPYSGSRAIQTPFGTIYGTNITPDPKTGIGAWSLEAFSRAMRQGIDREGHQLYPAFPYSHFTKLDDGDVESLYDFLMTRTPVEAETPANQLRFPFGFRPLIAGWNLLFLRQGPEQADETKPASLVHGAYLAEALSHCGACHSPRNALGAEEASKAYTGGEAEDWWAPPLNGSNVALLPWTREALFNYLRSWDKDHGGASGPMAPVAASLAKVPEADVRALADSMADQMKAAGADPKRSEAVLARAAAPGTAADMPGAAIYAGACATCHDSNAQVPFTLRSLALHSSVHAPDPRNVIQMVLGGKQPAEGHVGGFMPPFADMLSAKQIADVAAYVRARFSDQPPWTDVEGEVRKLQTHKEAKP